MFENIGEKIKLLAKIVCWTGIVAAVISGIVVMFTESFFGGLLIALVGAAGSWTGSFVMYGFGELVESAMVLRDAELKRQNRQANPPSATRRRTQPQQGGFSLSQLAAERQNQSSGSWICVKCGRKNANTSPVCGDCGSSRKDSVSAGSSGGYSLSQVAQQSESSVFSGWRCKKCGKQNSSTAMFCTDCGTSK